VEAIVEQSGAAVVKKTQGHHGEIRGLSLSRRSTQFEGRFGRMFRTLPPAQFDEDILNKLGAAMTAEFEAQQTPETEVDDEENSGISAGYTYFGQFIDHDLTFDPASSLQRQDDPDGLTDYRTPRFDLDNVYGRGPNDQPYLYRNDGLHMLLGVPLTGNANDSRARGVPRNTPESGEPQRALIGDPRNDENVIVSQLQASMLRFHNTMVEELKTKDFELAQRMVRWHYQWVVLHDFLPTIIGQPMVDEILGEVKPGNAASSRPPQLKFYKIEKEPFMPVEFSVAAYRFGHSMIRPIYRLNQTIDRLPIFDLTKPSLVGFRQFPTNWAIEWDLFFKMGDAPPLGPKRVQPAYKIDTSLVNPLGNLPPSIAVDPSSLPQRNLLRGFRMQLPSGQSVARAMSVDVIPDANLHVGKANESDTPTNKLLIDISKKFADNAPLWYYVLAEAQQQFMNNQTPLRLGPVGGRIVGEVFVGLMLADSHSYLRQHPHFQPLSGLRNNGKFMIGDLLLAAAKS
jgi:Animal haem peroxidase